MLDIPQQNPLKYGFSGIEQMLMFHTQNFCHRNSIAYSCKRFIHEFYMELFSLLQMYESLTFKIFMHKNLVVTGSDL